MEDDSLINKYKWIGISFLVIFSFMFLGGIHIGPLSVRMVVAYGLLGYVLWRGKTDYLPTRGMQLYFVYLGVYLFINLLNLTAFSPVFIKDLIAVHLVSCIAIFAFPRLFKTEASIRGAYIVVAFGFLLDAFTTFLQYNNSLLGWTIGMSINPTQQDELGEIQSVLENVEDFRRAILTGIMGNAVSNGYFIATMLPIMTYFIWDKFKLKTLWSFAMFAVAAICIYFIQQRMALAVAAAYLIAIITLKRTSIVTKIFFSTAAIIVIALYINDIQNYDYSKWGRLVNTEDELRSSTLTVLDSFISNPQRLLLGNNQNVTNEDYYIFHTLGHNTFTDSLRLGGIFLLLTYIVLFFFLCKTLIEIAFFSRCEEDFRTMGMAIGCLCYMLYSQTHSTGVQSGSIMFWTLYMLTIQSHRVRCEAIEEKEIKE
ncbi:MAG: hypothetical protein IKP36_01680 [Bacteroidaceae bacterium]|nr:hypothetical protein [Bacteroidaceae bacterium]